MIDVVVDVVVVKRERGKLSVLILFHSGRRGEEWT